MEEISAIQTALIGRVSMRGSSIYAGCPRHTALAGRRLQDAYLCLQEVLAERAGISTKYLQNLEGKRPKKATIVTLEKLAKAFGIPVWKLLQFRD